MSLDEKTVPVYDRLARQHQYFIRDYDEPLQKAFLARLPSPSKILDLGCGHGMLSAQFKDLGHYVTSWDPSIEIQKWRLQGLVFLLTPKALKTSMRPPFLMAFMPTLASYMSLKTN